MGGEILSSIFSDADGIQPVVFFVFGTACVVVVIIHIIRYRALREITDRMHHDYLMIALSESKLTMPRALAAEFISTLAYPIMAKSEIDIFVGDRPGWFDLEIRHDSPPSRANRSGFIATATPDNFWEVVLDNFMK